MDLDKASPLTIKFMSNIDPIFPYAVCKFFQIILGVFDFIIDAISGYSLINGSKAERKRARDDYEHSAQLVGVWGRGAVSPLIDHAPGNFLYLHKRYVSPDYVLDHDNITLFGITANQAMFCVSNPKQNVYETKFTPFVFMTQFIASEQLVLMPLTSLYKLADKVGDPTKDGRKVAILGMTARCGSTFVAQMMARVPNCRVMSEPFTFVHAHAHYMQGHYSEEEYKRLLRSIMWVQCKKENEADVKQIMIKMNNYAQATFPLLKKLCPNVRQMFVTRQIKPSTKSYCKIVDLLPRSFRESRLSCDFCYTHVCFPYDDLDWWDLYRKIYTNDYKAALNTSHIERLTLMYAGCIECYLRHKEDFDTALVFEDLHENPGEQILKVFKVLDISEEHVGEALKAVGQDSQQGIFGNMGSKKVVLTPEDWATVDRVLKMCFTDYNTGWTDDQFRKLVLEK